MYFLKGGEIWIKKLQMKIQLKMISRKYLQSIWVLAMVGKAILSGNIKKETKANHTSVRSRRK